MTFTLAAIAPLAMLAVLSEAITEQIKSALPVEPSPQVTRLIALGVGLALALMLQISLFAQATGATNVVGMILAGLVCSRGSNYVHDFFGMFSKMGDSTGQNTGS